MQRRRPTAKIAAEMEYSDRLLARAWAAGFNWYLNKALKVGGTYEETSFLNGAANGDRETEKVILTRFQVSF